MGFSAYRSRLVQDMGDNVLKSMIVSQHHHISDKCSQTLHPTQKPARSSSPVTCTSATPWCHNSATYFATVHQMRAKEVLARTFAALLHSQMEWEQHCAKSMIGAALANSGSTRPLVRQRTVEADTIPEAMVLVLKTIRRLG